MQFIYESELKPILLISGDNHKYLFKVRRLKVGETIQVTNFENLFR